MSQQTLQNLSERLNKARQKKKVEPFLPELKFGKEYVDLEGVRYPVAWKFTSGQIDSSVLAATVLLTGIANRILLLKAVTAFKVAGVAQIFRFDIQTGAAFATTRIISATDSNDKETSGQFYVLTSTERIRINVTTVLAASTIDWTISYAEMGFGNL